MDVLSVNRLQMALSDSLTSEAFFKVELILFVGYYDPINTSFDNENKQFSV